MYFNPVRRLLLLKNQTCSCIIPNGVHLTPQPILFTTVIMKRRTYWIKSNRPAALLIQCRIGYSPTSLRNQVPALPLFTEDLDYSPFREFQNRHFMPTNV